MQPGVARIDPQHRPTRRERVGGALLATRAFVVRGRAAGRGERRYRWGTWTLVVLLSCSALMNLASSSPWESYLLAPVAIVLAVLCGGVAATASAESPDSPHEHRGRAATVT